MTSPAIFANVPSMTVRVRLALIVSGMFLFAWLGGWWLGKYTVAGLVAAERQADADAIAQLEAREQADSERLARATPPPRTAEPIVPSAEYHECEGCDARLNRLRQLAETMGYYGVDALPDYMDEADYDDGPGVGDIDPYRPATVRPIVPSRPLSPRHAEPAGGPRPNPARP